MNALPHGAVITLFYTTEHRTCSHDPPRLAVNGRRTLIRQIRRDMVTNIIVGEISRRYTCN